MTQELEEAKAKLWKAGVLSWKLHKTQVEIYDAINNSSSSIFVILCSRQLGKSYMLCAYAIEYALKNPGAKIAYIAPQAKMVKKIIVPRIRQILIDCPRDLKPTYKVNEQVYIFDNGSEIHIAGTDAGRAENLRGQVFHLVLCDEAGFIDDLSYLVSSILVPMISTTRGRIILSSTPPVSPDHAFVKYVRQAEVNGNYIKKTIYDNPLIDSRQLKDLIEASGGENSDAWRREYLAEFITSAKDAVVPEATEELMKELVQEWPRPAFYDSYTSADLGYVDNTGIVFAYWDFLNAKLIIEDEAMFSKPTSSKIAEIVKEKEKSCWEFNGTVKQPYKRVVDGNDITIADLNAPPNSLKFVKTRNDDPLAAVNELRVMLYNKQIIINPRCKNLIAELKYAVWDNSGRKFARSDEDSRGHFDVLMALIYLIRNLNKQKNPYPPGLGLNIDTMYVHPSNYTNKSSNAEIMKKALLGDFNKRFGKE
jgi:hypothetical protein